VNYLDLLITGSLGLSVYQGYRRGILLSVARIVSYMAGLGVAIYYYRLFSDWLDEKLGLVERLASFLYSLLPLPRTVMTTAVDGLGFQELSQVVTALPLPVFYQQQMLTYLSNYQLILTGSILSIGETITLILAHTLVELIAFGVLFLGVLILVRRLGGVISRRANKSVFGGANRLAGAVLGLAGGLLIGAIGLGLLVPVVVLGQIGQIEVLAKVAEQVNSSKMTPFFLSLFTLFQASAGGILPFASGIFNLK
jgi:uncharacterized membrane protein required for colicin V production